MTCPRCGVSFDNVEQAPDSRYCLGCAFEVAALIAAETKRRLGWVWSARENGLEAMA